MKNKSIGLYGGSFNPIHLGHLNLAMEMLEKSSLDEVWLCPAQISPYKLNEPPISADHRLAMLKLAISDMPGLAICDLELFRPAPSYTIDTLEALLNDADMRNVAFSLIMGEDTAASFSQWHRAAEVASLVPLLVGCRSGVEMTLHDPFHKSFRLVHTKVFDVSSTDVRLRLAKGKCCRHLVREKVLDYINENRLYC